jgi:hypothetical protein
MFIPHNKFKSLRALLNLFNRLGIECGFAKLKLASHSRGYEIVLKDSERDKNTSDHRKKDFKL